MLVRKDHDGTQNRKIIGFINSPLQPFVLFYCWIAVQKHLTRFLKNVFRQVINKERERDPDKVKVK